MPSSEYSPLSGLPERDNGPENWALGFCISNFLSGVRDGLYAAAFESLFIGKGFYSEDGWELCRWPHRVLGADVVSDYQDNGFLAWTDPDDYGYEPSWRVYEEVEFKRLMAGCVRRHLESVVGAKQYESQLVDALALYGCSM